MSKKKAKKREGRRELELLVTEFRLPTDKADAIARRYGPSRERGVSAAATLCRIKSLLDVGA
jgi:hypothetical protein